MKIIYNGVELGIIKIHEFLGESIYDESGTDYLYTRYHISASAVVNGAAEVQHGLAPTSYKFASGTVEQGPDDKATAPEKAKPVIVVPAINVAKQPKGVVFKTAPSVPSTDMYSPSDKETVFRKIVREASTAPLTDQAIRFRLQSPRGRLYIFAGEGAPEDLLLESPADGSITDCKNGPLPKLYGVTAAMGEAETMVVDFQIETFVNESPNTNVLLSNRFSMTHIVDEDYYLTIAVQGEAHFRTDLLYKAEGINPDSLRVNLLLPIPYGCTRKNITITGLPDGTGVSYSFEDRQEYTNFVAGQDTNSASISVRHRQQLVSEASDLVKSGLALGERLLDLRGQILNQQWLQADLNSRKKRPRRPRRTPPPSPPS